MIVKGKKRHIIIIMKVPRDSQKQDVAVAQPVHDSNSNSSHYILCAVLPIYYGKPCEQARGGGIQRLRLHTIQQLNRARRTCAAQLKHQQQPKRRVLYILCTIPQCRRHYSAPHNLAPPGGGIQKMQASAVQPARARDCLLSAHKRANELRFSLNSPSVCEEFTKIKVHKEKLVKTARHVTF